MFCLFKTVMLFTEVISHTSVQQHSVRVFVSGKSALLNLTRWLQLTQYSVQHVTMVSMLAM